VQTIRKVGGGAAAITTSRAFDSSGGQVGTTITGDIPNEWLDGEATVTSVIFANDNSVTSIGYNAFSATQITSITIPNGVTSIGNYAFFLCTSLTTATIPNSVTSLGNYAFKDCTALSSVTFTATSSVTSIGDYTFQNCTSLSSITIPNSVTSIGIYAFQNTGLTSVTIPNSVTSIGDNAFRGSTNLATVLCRVAQSAFTGADAFLGTASPLVIQARITDASWTAGAGLTFQGNTNVTVIKTL